jgi:hypothetical protein
LEKKYRKNEMSDDIFFVCLNTIGRCYVVLGKWWARKEIDDMIKGIESHIIKPCASVIRDKKVDIDDWLDVDKEYDFWRKVMGES